MLGVQRSCTQRQKPTFDIKILGLSAFRGLDPEYFGTVGVASLTINARLDRIGRPRPYPELACELDHPAPPITAFSVPPKTARNGHFPK